MSKRKNKGIVSQKTIERSIPPNIDSIIEHFKTNINKLNENEFLNGFRLLRTYEERSEALLSRGYTILENELTESESYYYTTITVNLKSEIETWVKRKPFNTIKKELLSKSNIVLENPYTEFTVNDDKGNPQTFYKKK